MSKELAEQMYFITKGGAYYRANAQGYTTCKAEAGRFTLEQAISYSHPNGPDGPRDGIRYEMAAPTEKTAEAEAAELREENARLREALAKAGPIHAGPVGGELGRKYPDARQCVIEFAPEQASGAYDLQMALARIRAALGENTDG